ncbi:hypothetical protein ACJ41O_004644 [Fusarium nematophilum]
MADQAAFAGRTPPSDEEQNEYYYGLASQPKLVARSSTNIWSRQYDGWSIGKILSPVGPHAIADPWNDFGSPLRRAIIQALDGINWSAIDILRIGYERSNHRTGEKFGHPVTLLISVHKDSTTWAKGLAVVVRCHEILQLHGIQDVHCEMRESHFSRGVSHRGEAPASAPMVASGQADPQTEIRALRSEYLGLSIAASNNPAREGTKCLYLRLKDTGKIVALTCRHVIFHEFKIEPAFSQVDSDAQPRWTVIQPGDKTLAQHRERISQNFKDIKDMSDRMESSMSLHEMAETTWADTKMPTETKLRITQERYKQVKSSLETLRLAKRDLDELSDATRIFGHVIYAPGLGTNCTDTNGDRLRDWALIELHVGEHTTPPDDICNQVFIGNASKAEEQVKRARDVEGFRQLTYPAFDTETSTVFLRGTLIPEAEMRKPSEGAMSLGDDPAILVAKYGSSTGFTLGLATSIKSVTREPINGIDFLSEEWCIIGQKRNRQGRREDFSYFGDSGSCVWDMDGRIGGMLTGGNGSGSNGAFDTSYATPMAWLLRDIQREGFDVELV